ncbi:MAG: RluA family pseudouridine synthase [Candidatus Phytoplasma stylosanthis]|uniref:RluA family pseudouridine synthase n=1 Tax=Candidatus Phytoplasma stylosanthis TaxID=2798314 RepID=UPI0029399F56|nr:RluA family pseudouridine synthase [Candidatus Phytoplasma stylosanthis]MDV3167828.1 RluA family pseudouridine synthase [Candidatus Phytoplasma stylosanthis]MDV3170895.1 RluA family pseudouridine synthase [Candidatus Phytoplasma stylosanthis]MDV3173802.1 RluA family pseudouridine synthase [Candidatus Phytoplasma stylosanthis]MDV3174075.1 RluA family pseudouridine synthase [Candidatus Phytoplasma stylosanthis]MDV3202413.1 RluA family pseudouridine synthase [Candidatus Phytoplasma stylosanthi
MLKEEFIVENKYKKLRLDIFLTKKLNISRNKCYSFINSGLVLVNDKIIKKKSYILQENNLVKVNIIEKKSIFDIFQPVNLNLKIIYEDQYFVVIDKPLNLIVHPSSSYSGITLINGLYYQIKDFNCSDITRPGIIHRLDKNTTGLIIIGKTDESVRMMQNLIQKRKVQRVYWALIYGQLSHEYGTINLPIKRNYSNYLKMEISPQGKSAITHFRVLKKFSTFSLLELKLDTGRTHQIRIHLSYLKHPIVGDCLYGPKNQVISSQLLHSKKISFYHPFNNEEIRLEIDLSNHFKEFLSKIVY